MKASYNNIITYKQSRVWNKNGTDYIANSGLELTVTKGTVIPIETMGWIQAYGIQLFCAEKFREIFVNPVVEGVKRCGKCPQ